MLCGGTGNEELAGSVGRGHWGKGGANHDGWMVS